MNLKKMRKIVTEVAEEHRSNFDDGPLQVEHMYTLFKATRVALIQAGATTDDLVRLVAEKLQEQRRFFLAHGADETFVNAIETTLADAFGFEFEVGKAEPDGTSGTYTLKLRYEH